MAKIRGIFLEINPESGWVKNVRVYADTSQERRIYEGILARMVMPKMWKWLSQIMFQCKPLPLNLCEKEVKKEPSWI